MTNDQPLNLVFIKKLLDAGVERGIALERKVERLEKLIEEAPHDEFCIRVRQMYRLRDGTGMGCDCWKSRITPD